MKYILLLILLVTLSCNRVNYDNIEIDEFDQELDRIEEISDPASKQQEVDAFWNGLIQAKRVPLVQDSVAVFLFKGEARNVRWAGDFNGWGDNRRAEIAGVNIDGTDFWYAKAEFPSDARLDYKIVVDGSNWILDPANPHFQHSGFGPNSELRMPDWQEEPLLVRNPDAPIGTIRNEAFGSQIFDHVISYDIYLPVGYQNAENMNVIYVTDGQEYSDDQLGSMFIVLDNLHYLNLIDPTMAVFVSPLDPMNLDVNRRAEEFGNNEDYLAFYTDELIPHIDSLFISNISMEADHRAIIGTSLGGLNATYFGFSRPDVFGKMGIQAPAYWYREEIYELVKTNKLDNPDIYMSVGTIGDNTIDARNMKFIFEEEGYEFTYLEVNEGHSWGAWRTQLDDILIQFFGK